MEIGLLADSTAQCSALSSYYLPGESGVPLPEPERRARVYGDGGASRFLLQGKTHQVRIEQLAARFMTSPPARPLRVLDWGCGCAGVARHFTGVDLCGVDIDFDNIAWCRDNIRWASFTACELMPPLPFESASFDLIYGISVLTHLDEAVQLAWLEELSRLLAPHGVALLSVHGLQALCKIGPGPVFDAWWKRGFLSSPDNHRIGEIISNPSYYGVAYHSYFYVLETWSRFFDVAAYIPAGLSHQDLVVLTVPNI